MGGSQPYIGMLLLVPYNFAPLNWNFCNGQLVAISENPTLYQLIGTTYGGDGQNTYGLPDLRGRTPVSTGSNGMSSYVLGQRGGVENVTLNQNQMPSHSHVAFATTAAQTSGSPNGNALASGPACYEISTGPNSSLAQASITTAGSSVPHSNLQPYQTLNWIISMFGIFPSQN